MSGLMSIQKLSLILIVVYLQFVIDINYNVTAAIVIRINENITKVSGKY